MAFVGVVVVSIPFVTGTILLSPQGLPRNISQLNYMQKWIFKYKFFISFFLFVSANLNDNFLVLPVNSCGPVQLIVLLVKHSAPASFSFLWSDSQPISSSLSTSIHVLCSDSFSSSMILFLFFFFSFYFCFYQNIAHLYE